MKRALVIVFLTVSSLSAQAFVQEALLLERVATQIQLLNDQIEQLAKQYKLLEKNSVTANLQLEELEKFTSLNSGPGEYGDFHNSDEEVEERKTIGNWHETLKEIAGGNNERYQELVKSYEEQNKSLNEVDLTGRVSPEQEKLFHQQVDVNRAAYVESEDAYNSVNTHIKSIKALTEKIKEAKTTKLALDLNTRLLAEIAYLQADNLKAQAIVNKQLAAKAQKELAEDAAVSSYLYKFKDPTTTQK